MMNMNCFGRNLITASSSLPLVQIAAQKEAHFWYVLPNEVKSTNLLNRYLEILSPCEKENVFHMRGEQLTKRALLTRVLVRTTLARYQMNCQINPKSLKFRTNNYGKPEEWVDLLYTDDWSPPPLHFNISHTSSLIAYGVTVGSPIGIDVEEKQRALKNDILTFARRYLSPQEIEMPTHIADHELQRQEFIKLWTLKINEAYVKAQGKGFSASPFKIFTVQLRDHMEGGIHIPPHMISKNLSSNWQFVLLELAGSHYAVVCIGKDRINTGKGSIPINLTIRKTIPFVEDECILQ
ncbi:uncharacterized protein LOC113870905 [Abrus precatorius]|uniref:holo-[acyl-carrier-protein] synthase n=1 Tax=Abrus precatorius TaxID=3816 RepID=A0A8B8M861_ABRPR|nr:uncharacterized protein LOC113870905 [Abrus precatorius]